MKPAVLAFLIISDQTMLYFIHKIISGTPSPRQYDSKPNVTCFFGLSVIGVSIMEELVANHIYGMYSMCYSGVVSLMMACMFSADLFLS